MRNALSFLPFLFMAVSIIYGLYTGEPLPLTVGIVSAVLYALSLRGEDLPELTGLVAMFSSIFALWKNPLRYLSIVGVVLLAILEVSAAMRRKEIKGKITFGFFIL
ncbi:hypothetical protein [Thermococcus sp.]